MNHERYFPDQVVVITGSSRGIGRETARQALHGGARVVLNGRDPVALEETRLALDFPDRTMAVAADLGSPEEAQYLVAATLAAWGRIDVLINNAGLSMRGPFADLSDVTVRAMVDANFLSAVWVTRAALPALRESRGRVVFVSSLAGLRGFPQVSLYSASKMALTALHQSLRAEEGPRGISFGIVFLAFTENDPDKTVLTSSGQPFRHERPWSQTQGQAATAVLRMVATAKKKTVVSARGLCLAVAQSWFPGLVDRFVAGSGNKIHRVEEKRP